METILQVFLSVAVVGVTLLFIFAQLKLFSIDSNLKKMLKIIKEDEEKED